jgi:UDP-N-acetylmuramoyl-tripeptide--D-alanyl-D-alanine ligase
MQGNKKIMLLGSMMELGEDSKMEHESIISLINKYQWEAVVLVGKNFNDIQNRYINLESSTEAGEWLKTSNPKDSLILIKGSRSMQMEKVLAL